MPTFHGYGYSSQSDNNSNHSDEDVALNYLRRFLRNRYNEIEKNPGLKNDINYRLNQSGVWYNLRPEMIEAGFEPKKDWGTTRSYIQNSINDVCEELSKEFRKTITREDLNIVASARGIMFFEGQYIPVTIDAIRTLANQGVGIIVIEKSGILELLKDYAQEYGVALIQTQGRFVDYIKDLIEIAKNATAPIATLTDYDIDGITMADETRTKTPRIGIDIDTIEWFNENGFPDLTREDLEEEYSPTRYMESKYVQENEYLKTHRIELDSVIASVGSEAFWNYCKHQLETIFKERGFNYNKVIKPPETINLYPNKITDMISKLENYINKTVEPEWKNIEKDMSNSKELIVVNDKQESNTEELSSKIENDSTMKEKIIPKISNLLEQLTTILG